MKSNYMKKGAISALKILCVSGGMAQLAYAADVTVSSPANGATVSTSFSLVAQSSTCEGETVASMAYSIGDGTDSTAVKGTALDTEVTATTGSGQILRVKSWGNKGSSCVTNTTINVVASSNTASSTGVTVTSPEDNADVNTTFTLEAKSTTCDGQPVVSMAYSIGGGSNSTAIDSTSLNEQVSMSAGNNQVLHVKSWGNKGAGCDTDLTLNVASSNTSGGTGYSGSPTIPIPPSSADHVSDIQELSGWAGKTGAASQCPDGVASSTCHPISANFDSTVVHTSDPISLAGSNKTSGEFEMFQSPGNATAIWGHSVGTLLSATHFIWDFYVYVSSVKYGNSELDFYTSGNGGQRFMMGTQCDRGSNSWDTWNEGTQKWIKNTSIPCNELLPADKWLHVVMYNTIDISGNTYTYKTFNIGGKDYILNQTEPTKHVGWPDGKFGVQVQLDLNSSGSAVNEYIENMQVYAW